MVWDDDDEEAEPWAAQPPRDPVPAGEEILWSRRPARCAACGHGWHAVYPIETDRLECPRCGMMTAAPALPGEPQMRKRKPR